MRIMVMDAPDNGASIVDALRAADSEMAVEVLPALTESGLARLRLARPDVVILSQDVDPGDRALDAYIGDIRSLAKRLILLSVPAPPTDPLLRAAAAAGAEVVLANADRHLPLARIVAAVRQAPEPGPAPDTDPAEAREVLGPSDRVRQLVSGWRQWRPGHKPAALEWEAPTPAPVSANRPKPARHSASPRVMAVRQLVAVGGLGGGRGTSRTAVFLAKALSQHGTVFLMDWDARGGLTPWTGLPPSDRVWEALQAASTSSVELVWDWVSRLWALDDQWSVLTAAGRWPERALPGVDTGLIQAVLAWALAQYDFVVVDVGSDWSDPRAQWVYQQAQKAVLCVGTGESEVARAHRWLKWVEIQGWAVSRHPVFVGTGTDKAWRQGMRVRWLADWDRDTEDAVGAACADYVMTPEARPAPRV